MSSYLITGASRGIGFELTKQLSNLNRAHVSKVFATTRGQQPSKDLSELIAASAGCVIHIPCEVTKPLSIEKAVALVGNELGRSGLDVLVNNAGIQTATPDGMCSIRDTQLLGDFDTNVVSVQRMTSALMPLLRKGKRRTVINMSTSIGSIAYASRFTMTPSPVYKITKAALNMLTVQYALELGKEGFTVLAISPGWLKTDMGSPYADLEVETGVQAVVKIILEADPEVNGKFLNVRISGWEEANGPNQYDGGEIPW